MKSDNRSRCTPLAQLRLRFFSLLGSLADQFRPPWSARRAAGLLLLFVIICLLAFPSRQTAMQQDRQASAPQIERKPVENGQATARQTGEPSAPSAQANSQLPGSPTLKRRTRDEVNLPSQRFALSTNSLAVSYRLPEPTASELRPTSSRQIGVVRPVNLPSNAVGQAFSNNDNSQLRVIALQSPGAVELRVHFTEFDLPPGDEVYVYGRETDSPVAGPYTNQGPLQGVSATKGPQDFWSDTITGDTVIIEHLSKGERQTFTISELVHNYKAFLSDQQPQILGCHNDANCTADILNDSVGRISYVSGGGGFLCSGTMLNDQAAGELAPYFLTANHCISTPTEASTVQALWFFRSTFCNSGVAGAGTVSPTGATLLNHEQQSDHSLLRILYTVPSNLVYSGWTAAAQANSTSVYGLHHPAGSYLRRSSGSIISTTESCAPSGLTNGYRVDWSSGATEPGSSGSGLRISNGQLVGVDSCGYCTPQSDGSCTPFCTADASYGRFSDFYADISSYMSFGDYGYSPAFAPFSSPRFSYNRTLTGASPPSRVKGVSFYGDSFGNFNGVAGQQVVIAVNSTAFDTFVYLLGPNQRRLIAFDDDNGPGTNSLISVTLPETGEYIIHVTSFDALATGGFDVNCSVRTEKADFDADGQTDFSVWRPGNGVWYAIRSISGIVTQQWGLPGDVPVPGDYDNDGKTDYAVWRPSNGVWYVIRSGSGSIVTQQWGLPGDVPVPGDYDNDGRTDYAVWRPSNGFWYVIRSGSGLVVTQQWGLNGDIPVAHDYDSDGRTDYAVWRPSNGFWYVIRSLSSSVVTQQWGLPGDVPVPGDYDNDGRTDYAVWRPANGFWFVIRSSNNLVVTQQWGLNGDVSLPSAGIR